MKHRFQPCQGAGQTDGRPITKLRGTALAAALLATSLSACNDRSTPLVERAAFVRTEIVQQPDQDKKGQAKPSQAPAAQASPAPSLPKP